jgi:2-desacetyl-2-hydroxyethyl bacteriochlorophyllide A dehydrogenase
VKALVLEHPGRFILTDAAAPSRPAADEALVRVRRIGICGTDLHAFRGRQPFFSYPRILGHELGVEIVDIDPHNAAGLRPGDPCALAPYLECGACTACRRGRPNCCARLQVLGVHVDGGMRELLTVPWRKLHRAAALSLDQLAIVEPLSIGAHAVARGELPPGEWALVIGAGPIGLAVMQFAALAGARVIAMDTNAERLRFAQEHLPIASTLLLEQDDPADALKALADGDLPVTVFDATGSARSMTAAFRYTASAGRLVLVGLCQEDVSFADAEFHRRELTLVSSRNATGADFDRVIAHLESGAVNIDPWITDRRTLAEVPDRFDAWTAPGTSFIKAIVSIDA